MNINAAVRIGRFQTENAMLVRNIGRCGMMARTEDTTISDIRPVERGRAPKPARYSFAQENGWSALSGQRKPSFDLICDHVYSIGTPISFRLPAGVRMTRGGTVIS